MDPSKAPITRKPKRLLGIDPLRTGAGTDARGPAAAAVDRAELRRLTSAWC